MQKKKRIASTLYLDSRLKFNGKEMEVTGGHDGTLFAYGKYPTKIRPEDIPGWFVSGFMYGRYGYISAMGVKDLLYKPNYEDHSLRKGDRLYVSYNMPIIKVQNKDGWSTLSGHDHVIEDSLIDVFVDTVSKYSAINTEKVKEELVKKDKWYAEQGSIGGAKCHKI